MFKHFHQVNLQVLERNYLFPLLRDLGFLNFMGLSGYQIKLSLQEAHCRLRSAGENAESQKTKRGRLEHSGFYCPNFQSYLECVIHGL